MTTVGIHGKKPYFLLRGKRRRLIDHRMQDTALLKTFVYHEGALGDVLLSLPCFKRLKANSAWVHGAGRGDVVSFLKNAGVVDDASSTDAALFAYLYGGADTRLQSFLSRFGRAVVFAAQDHSPAVSAIQSVVHSVIAVRTIPPDGSQVHVSRYRISQLDSRFSLSDSDMLLRLPPETPDTTQMLLREAGYDGQAEMIAVHPGSGGRAKCWPLERYFETIERLTTIDKAFVVFFTGSAEDDDLRERVGKYVVDRKNSFHANNLDLMSAAYLLSRCALYIGNDSGFSHLAGLLGCATIVLFGPTDPAYWKPLGPRVKTVSLENIGPITRISVENVIAKAETLRKKLV
jgi:heptosyltransferase-3